MDTARKPDRVCRALGDPTRRRLLERLGTTPGATTGTLAATEPSLSRWAILKHLDVLRKAGLVHTLPEGRRRRHYRELAALRPLTAWLEELGD